MKRITVILITMLVLSSGFKRDKVDTGSRMKAIFIMNFTKLIEWPKPYKKGSFVVGVLGDSPLSGELDKMAQTKKVAHQILNIKKFSTLSDVSDCHILYVSENKSAQMASLIKKVKARSTLIITEKEGLTDKGAGINFIVKNNRQKFELNKGNVEKYKLKISSDLEGLAFSVK